MGKGRQMFWHFEIDVMVSLKIGEELERECKFHESSSNKRKDLKLNVTSRQSTELQWIPPINLVSCSYVEKYR